MTFAITVISLLVMASVIKQIFDPAIGNLSLLFLAVFASGKSAGAFLSLKAWQRHENCSIPQRDQGGNDSPPPTQTK